MPSLSRDRLINFVDAFRGRKILVLGDVMLDRFVFGEAERISPEAPIPVVLARRELVAPGGAANVAANIAALGGAVTLCGVVGDDSAARALFSVLAARGVNTAGIERVRSRRTTEKLRVLARGQQIVRVDHETDEAITPALQAGLLRFIRKGFPRWEAVLVADYAKGVLTQSLAEKLLQTVATRRRPLLVDAKPQHAHYFRGATLFTPNHQEAVGMAGVQDVRKAGPIIQKRLRANILITQGAEGMTLFEKSSVLHFPAQAREVFDVTGAGDTVQAVIGLALAAGATLGEAVLLANHAAGIVVAKIGTAVVLPEELKKSLFENA